MFDLLAKRQNDASTAERIHAAKLPPKVAVAAAGMFCRGWIGISQKRRGLYHADTQRKE
ncbi:hypothetical protein [Prosthecobacter sp.]|uniref:hypothetical protein n=1 Tax=Prosthecobacter sp. TaxID=1965333 RepID=UPI0025DA9AC9|nr:hypothetical protein [Prosthecobacter sp.]